MIGSAISGAFPIAGEQFGLSEAGEVPIKTKV